MEVISLGDQTVGRASFESGWRWSESVKPLAGTPNCEVAHFGYIIAGRMHALMDGGTEGDANPGDLFEIAPGHDAWIVGDGPGVVIDFRGAASYAH
jgi:hypothetical protein